MRIPFLSRFFSRFMASPFDGLQEHAEKVKVCAWTFQQAIECYVSDKCLRFEELRQEVIKLESEADAIKKNIRGHLPKGTVLPVDKFELFRYLREQDQVPDAMEDVLDLISYRSDSEVPKALEKDFFLLVDAVIDPVEDLSRMVTEAKKYFRNFSDNQRDKVKAIIRNLANKEHEADILEDSLKRNIFQLETDPVTVFHMIRLTETIGSIADHAENAGDMMRSMIAR
jgi:predicted phosphate transport protein (TIGR00153 family)